MTITSCELTYEDNTRLLVEGQIISFENEDLPELSADVYALGVFSSFPATREKLALIGETKLKADGEYQVISISPENSDFISVVINDDKNGFDSFWPTIEINGIEPLSLENFKYQIPEIRIGRLVNSKLRVNRMVNTQDTLLYTIAYNSTVKKIDLNTNEIYNPHFQNEKFGEVYPADMTKEISLKVIEGDSISLSYSLINNGIVKQDNIKIHYDKQINGYEFEF